MNRLWQDLRYGLRMLRKNPGFTAVAVLTLSLGLGANTAVFNFVNSLLLQPVSLPEPNRIVRIYATTPEGRRFSVFSYPNYADVRDRNQVFEHLAVHRNVGASFSANGQGARAEGELVSGNYFSALGVHAALGRTLRPEDDKTPAGRPVVVISDGLWKRRFGGSPGIVGQAVRLNDHPFTVVGVMPEGFRGTYETWPSDFWIPIVMVEQVRPTGLPLTHRGWGWLSGTGRLKPGIALEPGQADVDRVALQLAQEFPRLNEGYGFALHPASTFPESYQSGVARFLGFFMLIASLVLLLACANIASVLLTRVVGRRREIAIRQSLGARRLRLIRQWVTESTLLSLAGGVVGLLFAYWTQRGLLALLPLSDFPSGFSPHLDFDAKVLSFMFLLTLITGVIFGFLPALRAGRIEVATALKGEAGTTAGGRQQTRLFGGFVVAQVIVSMVLLIAAGLLLRTLREAQAFNPGFNTGNLLLATVNLRPYGYNQARGKEFYQQLTERLRALPGVQGVTFASVVPLGGDVVREGFRIPGHEPAPDEPTLSLDINHVGPDYFATLGIPILRGRGFDRRDMGEGASPTIMINETLARRYWPGEDPVGKSIRFGSDGPFLEIIGVARDIKYYSLGEEPLPYVYVNFGQYYVHRNTIHLRTTTDLKALVRAIGREVEALDAKVPVTSVRTFEELRQIPLFPQRALASVTTIFAGLALLLTMIGLYGVVSYSVTQRRHEIGVRVALGAHRLDILRSVVGRAMALTFIGVGLGLVAALSVTRFLENLLFGVTPTDPLTFVGISLLMATVALLACLIPARRATRVDPMVALRYE